MEALEETMNTNWKLLAAMGLLAACSGDKDSGSKGGYVDRDTADIVDPDDSGTTGVTDCDVVVQSFAPESGSVGVYYRAPMEVAFDEDASALGVSFTLTDPDGGTIGTTATFDDTGFKATVVTDTALEALTEYKLSVGVCGSTSEAVFTTSEYGGSLSVDASALAGATYHFSLGDADYTQPEGLGALLASFLEAPLLIGVSTVEGETLNILGTQGMDSGGAVVPDPSFDVWDFGPAALEGAYFASSPTNIELEYGCATIPIYDFALDGTFSADGATIGGGHALGLGDSRNMGCLAGLGSDPDAICNYAASFGFACEECPDGNPWCLTIEAWFDPAPLLPDVSLEAAR
jgi:hypothetical protein